LHPRFRYLDVIAFPVCVVSLNRYDLDSVSTQKISGSEPGTTQIGLGFKVHEAIGVVLYFLAECLNAERSWINILWENEVYAEI
jgi:hypothetical protein